MTGRVVIGATFACDDALEQPLLLLLREAVAARGDDAAPVNVEWLPYGSATQLGAWSSSLAFASATATAAADSSRVPVDLVLLLVRVSDLEAAHPEQQLVASCESQRTREHPLPSSPSSSTLLSPSLEQFARELEQYCCSPEPLPPLVVIATPCAPDHAQRFLTAELQLRACVDAAATTAATLAAAENSSAAHAHAQHNRIRWLPSSHVLELFRLHNAAPHDALFYDRVADQLQHAPYTQRMLNTLSLALCRQSCRLVLPSHNGHHLCATTMKKVIVLDCDNTLWGGAVAEVGAHGVALTAPFLALQRFVVTQQQRGMLLCLCSKNAEQDVAAVFRERRADMVLQLDTHIALTKINWQHKSRNIEALARELALGLDAFVFIDDNPVECSEVASALPMVTIIHVHTGFPVGVLDHEWVFDDPIESPQRGRGRDSHGTGGSGVRTREDAQRTRMYQQNAQRHALRRVSGSHRAFLSSLDVKIVFETLAAPAVAASSHGSPPPLSSPPSSPSFDRVLQLHQRTNQFNVATSFSRALTDDALRAFTTADVSAATGATNAFAAAVCAHVTDRFGHYGLVGIVLCRLVVDDGEDDDDKRSARPAADAAAASLSLSSSHRCRRLHVDSFLLSCRALNRGVEHAMVRHVAELAQRLEAPSVMFAWEPTNRNEPAREFFASLAASSFTAAAKYGRESQQPCDLSRADKLRRSAVCRGEWTIATHEAARVAFLKTDDNERVAGSTELCGSYSPAAWTTLLTHITAFITRIVVQLVQCVLPRWLVSFVSARWQVARAVPALLTRSHTAGAPPALLCQRFCEPETLNAFIATHTGLVVQVVSEHRAIAGSGAATEQSQQASSTTTDSGGGGDDGGPRDAVRAPSEQEASKFRRKARHQTKLALRSHLTVDTPDVIWSANRRTADSASIQSNGDDIVTACDVLVLQSHKPCGTLQCVATLSVQSACSFQRCRTCCYKIQRLLGRLRSSAHEIARQTAAQALTEQFNVVVSSSSIGKASASDTLSAADSVCSMHRNERRRH